MNSGAKLAAFALVLAVTFGGAMAVGATVGPIDVGESTDHATLDSAATGGAEMPPGLAVAAGGYRLAVEVDTVVADAPSTFAFAILDDGGEPATQFDELHERRLHLIVLSRNLVDYLHLHPTVDADGRWTVELPALRAGSYRFFADFQPAGGDNLTLGTDITVSGVVGALSLPPPASVDDVDEYSVELSGDQQIGESELSFTVRLDGQPVRTEPYLGAAGHLVAIRSGDLAYLHVHPHEDDATPVVSFTAEFPSAGTYRLFFDFSHDGEVRTAAYTLTVPDGEGRPPTPSTHEEGH